MEPIKTRASVMIPVIEQWRVLGEDRVCGLAYRRPGKADGGTIITSQVLRALKTVVGNETVVVTHTGTHYRLGQMALQGREESTIWLHHMLHHTNEQRTEPMPLMISEQDRTVIIPPEQIERIVLDRTSFAPLT